MKRTSQNANYRLVNVSVAAWAGIASLVVSLHAMVGSAQDLPSRKSPSAPLFQVLVFLGTDCPISQDYVGALNSINARFIEYGRIRGIIPGNTEKQEVRSFQKDYQVEFPLEWDKSRDLEKKYSITVTPEVVVLDAVGEIRYRGAIDNWYYELGRHRQTVTEHYLINAINSLIEGKTVDVKQTEPIGCVLSMHH